MERNYLLIYANGKIDQVGYEFFETLEDLERMLELAQEVNKEIQLIGKFKVEEIK